MNGGRKIWRRVLLGACMAIFLFGMIGSLCMLRSANAAVVEILQDGKLLYRIDLSQLQQEKKIDIVSPHGTNIVSASAAGVYIESADCADQRCVAMGKLKSAALPIVCLPHRLVIRYADDISN